MDKLTKRKTEDADFEDDLEHLDEKVDISMTQRTAARSASEFKQILRKSTHEKSKTAEKTLSSPTSRKRKSNVIKTKFSKITSKANQTLSKRTGITNSKYIKRDSKSKPSLMKQKLKTVTDKNDDDEMSSNNNLESKKRQSEKTIVQTYNVMEVNKLSKEFPDEYWQFHAESGYGMISYINEEHVLELLNVDVSDY
ncbi:15947_t:CDS:2, partial [Entrophospora sp. SA101]